MSEHQLPEGWAFSAIQNLTSADGLISDGDWVESKDQDPSGSIRLIQLADIGDGDFRNKSNRFMSEEKATLLNCTFLAEGDVLVARMPDPLGRACLFPGVGQPAVTVVDVCLIRVGSSSALTNQLLKYWINSPSFRGLISENASGTTRKRITRKKLEKFEVPVPPLAEQKVIADKLDTLLAQVENTKARLERIPQILKRFRQSVLAAAVSGRLTEEWRNGDNRERSFKKLGEAGVDVKTGPFGSALHKSDYVIGGIPVINPMHISEGTITPSNSMTISQQKYMSLEAWHLRKGDVVVGRRGEMGRASVVTSDEPQLCGTGSMILRVGNDALPKYLEIILRSPTAVSYFNSASVGSTMVNLNQKVIKNLEVYFPSLDEQTEIVRRVDHLFAHADRIEQQINNALARVNNLTQSILAKAFRGELTEQWRKDNPELISGDNSAEALLERIKAEQAAAKPAKKIRKKMSS